MYKEAQEYPTFRSCLVAVGMSSTTSSLSGLSQTKFHHSLMGLIGNYHYGFNIEHTKQVLEKGLIVNSLLGDIPTATKQAAGKTVGPAGFLVLVSKSNLTNLERALKNFKLQLEFKYDWKIVQVTRVLVVIARMTINIL